MDFSKETETGLTKDDLTEWLSTLDPQLVGQMSTLSDQALSKLKVMYVISKQTDCNVKHVSQKFLQMGNEYIGLSKKLKGHILRLGIDTDDLSPSIRETSQAICDLLLSNNIGDGTNAGAAITLTDQVLESSQNMNQRIILQKSLRTIKQENSKLSLSVILHKDYLHTFTLYAESLQQELIDDVNQRCILEAEANKYEEHRLLVKAELDRLGINDELSDLRILNDHKCLKELQMQVKILQDKLKKEFEDLPPSVFEAVELIRKTKKELAEVTETLKEKLMCLKRY